MNETDRWIENEKAHAQIRNWLLLLTVVVLASSPWAAKLVTAFAGVLP